MSPWHMTHTGHQRLSDGTVLRLDAELGKYCASWYRQGVDALELHAYSYGSFDAMRDLVGDWADAHEASLTSPVGGETAGSGAAIPAPGQPNLLGEIA